MCSQTTKIPQIGKNNYFHFFLLTYGEVGYMGKLVHCSKLKLKSFLFSFWLLSSNRVGRGTLSRIDAGEYQRSTRK